MGVFATRSPNRPNPLGLSAVAIDGVEDNPEHGTVIHVRGADLLDGTPIYDIKPYIPYADCLPDAVGGFASVPPDALTVEITDAQLARLPPDRREALVGILALDPRPAYQEDSKRVHGLEFAGFEVKFHVAGNVLTVVAVEGL